MADALSEARDAFSRRAWRQAEERYRVASAAGPLPAEDIERLATAVQLLGRQLESREILASGYHRELEAGSRRNAARFAFWVGHGLIFAGEESQSRAWFSRARELLAGEDGECAESGMIRVADAIRALGSGDAAGAERAFSEALRIGRTCAEPSVVAMASHGLGRALIAQGRFEEGMAALDEVMVSATEGRVPPLIVGELYCGVLEACHDTFDFRRAREWTAALTRWCDSQPELVPYRGPCMVHRVELLRLGGEWQDALAEAQKACDWLSASLSPEGPGDAYYQLGELHRLRGQYAEAEEAYRNASRHGKRPEPGIALLWLARGQVTAAATAVARAIEEAADDRVGRAELLGAYVEILLAGGDAARARQAATELGTLADLYRSAALQAATESARGRVLIAEGSPAESLAPLRRAWAAWQRLDAPYEAARVRVQIAIAYRALGDIDSAAMEIDAARWVFQDLGALPELSKLDAMSPPPGAAPVPGGLTPREIQVLRLIVDGRTNKEIAADLVISEHTVARHVQNMLAKLGLPSRTGLAAFAIENGLASGPRSQL